MRTADWLRGLERSGLIPAAKRDWRGFRYYEPEDETAIDEFVRSHRQQQEAEAV
jgi:DNA-binding transcriptional MerR regulator